MRENGTSGTVRGAPGNRRSYRREVCECQTGVPAETKTGILGFPIHGTMRGDIFGAWRVQLRTYRTMPEHHSSR